jgi:hypothetical protein
MNTIAYNRFHFVILGSQGEPEESGKPRAVPLGGPLLERRLAGRLVEICDGGKVTKRIRLNAIVFVIGYVATSNVQVNAGPASSEGPGSAIMTNR